MDSGCPEWGRFPWNRLSPEVRRFPSGFFRVSLGFSLEFARAGKTQTGKNKNHVFCFGVWGPFFLFSFSRFFVAAVRVDMKPERKYFRFWVRFAFGFGFFFQFGSFLRGRQGLTFGFGFRFAFGLRFRCFSMTGRVEQQVYGHVCV